MMEKSMVEPSICLVAVVGVVRLALMVVTALRLIARFQLLLILLQRMGCILLTRSMSAGNFGKEMDMNGTEISGTSPPLNVLVEPLIGLKLGKRTYFENSENGGNTKTKSFSVKPTSSSSTPTKPKSSDQNTPMPRCQVDDCNLDLSMAKEYHRKHRVCGSHSKCSKVIVGEVERRFCQQCYQVSWFV